jgi:hypothetical protein
MNTTVSIVTICFLLLANFPSLCQSEKQKPRTIVTTDGEVDDVDSFIRMLLYANEFELAGLIYSSSQWHYSGDGKGTKFTSEMPNTAARYGERTELRWPGTTWMQEYIEKYRLVFPNLSTHAQGYPSPDALLGMIHTGNIEFEGEMQKDTDGSDHIKKVLLDNDPRPVFLQIWGGTNTVARALKSIKDEHGKTEQWADIHRKVSEKAILYTVLDQDATYRKYISIHWPGIRVYYNSDQFWSFAYLWPRVVPEDLKVYMSGKWFAENILFNHGPLLAEYFTWGDGRRIKGDPEHTHGDMEEAEKYKLSKYDFISEGDSPAYLFLVDVGIGSIDDPSLGGWGGRMARSDKQPNRWEDGDHVQDFNYFTKAYDKNFPQTRWIPAIQNDMAARADWCVLPVEKANHPPVVSLVGNRNIAATPGQILRLSGTAADPDDDKLSFSWWQYHEADSYPGKISIDNAGAKAASLNIPGDAKVGDEIHIILEVSDNGVPVLTRYQRAIIKIK